MNHLELCARNVSSAIREAMNAQSAFMLGLGIKFPVNFKKMKREYPVNERLLRDMTAAIEHLGTAQDTITELLRPVRKSEYNVP